MSRKEPDPRTRDLGYLNRRRVSPQWSAFLSAMAAELSEIGDEAGARSFMRAIGARLARMLALPGFETLEGLEEGVNEVWAEMDWGWTQLTALDDHILITHGACPNGLESDHRRAWPPLMGEVLAGAYGAWLSDQGSPGGVTTCVDPMASPLVFEHRV